ncbi:adenylate/guanylate cyclase domain-containing protein [Candidatus Woesearchaeota archaeon]|nr:adenylate/guanylate cyclase domain-containing protein [Candidatus Woesearchaeota archaeon]
MAASLYQAIYLLLLLFAFYGCLKSFLVYKKKRESKYLIVLALFFMFTPQLWLKAYGIRVEQFLSTFQFFLALIPLAMFIFYDYWERRRIEEEKEKVKIKTFFSRYVSPKIIDKLLEKKHLDLSGKRQIITVFFMDVRGFTKLSENISAEEVVKILNQYFNISTDIILKYDGTVDKFVGDAVMAIFNAPTAVSDHELKAVRAALEIQHEIKKWRKISVGIGIHTGTAVVGNIGSKHKLDYTAIGDTVNTAARLEGQTSAGDVVVSTAIYEKVKGSFPTKHHEEVTLKGKALPVEIHRYRTATEKYL